LKIENGHRYTNRLEVRADGLRGLIDGQEVFKWSGDYRRLSTEAGAQLHDPRALAVGSYSRAVVFHRIEVREIKGRGNFLYGAAPPPPPQPQPPTGGK
jgi:hypothetical protein